MTDISLQPLSLQPVSAAQIAARLELPPPTEEQRAIIEAPLEPALVVAGAGSGKTETMASRALWLVANGLVGPSEILGLTFTRKAAGELSERMTRRIDALRREGLVRPPAHAGHLEPIDDLLDAPTVSTYNSFAGTIYREHAAVVGLDGDAVVLGEASAWLMARRLVRSSRDLRLGDSDSGIDQVTSAVARLSAALTENVAEPAAVIRMAEEFCALGDLPLGDRHERAGVLESIGKLAPLPALVDAAVEFARQKADRGYIEFSDQVAVALRIIERVPAIAEELRGRFRMVILDEYQDTSDVQARLLSLLFRGHPVMAVGDPNQAIYGWRGASAANLGQFAERFDARSSYTLRTSWRNPSPVLDLANRILEPLAGAAGVAVSGVPVARLLPRTDAGREPVAVHYSETVVEEATEVARWLRAGLDDRALWSRPRPDAELQPPTAALILRARATLEHFTRALTAHGVKFHVLGVGGLLSEPVIADLVAALSVIDSAEAGSELIRLLVGSTWRIGTADIAALHGVARWLEQRDLRQQRLDEATTAALRASVAAEDAASLVDALDFVATAPDGHIALGGLSAEGLTRLRDAGRTFAELRGRVRLDLVDLVTVVIQRLGLDLEAEANESRTGVGRVFEAFFDAVSDYEQLGLGSDQRAELSGFLSWIREAETRDRLAPRSDPPEPGRVQIITIHGAKGLEWDLVAVPRMVDGELPRTGQSKTAWLAMGELPYEFRGDSAALPVLAWRSATDRKQVGAAIDAFKAGVGEQQLEEDRRLAYVAVTRARTRLLLTGSFWSSQTAARKPSRFLSEAVEAGILDPLPSASEHEVHPLDADPDAPEWPRDPLGSRRGVVERAAEAVRSADPARDGEWSRELNLLLEERRRALAGGVVATPGPRIPASRFKDYVSDPGAVAAQLRRPMPERPYRATRLGTLFHAWVERRADPAGLDDELDAGPDDLDGDLIGVDADAMARLKATFESSPWATLQPVEVEREIHLPFDGRIVVCKIDAVYRHESADGVRWEIVDWKTGKAPADEADLEAKQTQLALYRLAYARWAGIDPADIDAVFYFVADDRIIRPESVDSEEQLLARWRAAVATPLEST